MLKKKHASIMIILVLASMLIVTGCSNDASSKLGEKEANITLDKLEYAYENNDNDAAEDIGVKFYDDAGNLQNKNIVTSLNTISDAKKIKEVTIEKRKITISPDQQTATASGIIMVTAEKEENSANAYITVELIKESDNSWEINNDPLTGVNWITGDDKEAKKKAEEMAAVRDVTAKFFTAYKQQKPAKLKETLIPEIDDVYETVNGISLYKEKDLEYNGTKYAKTSFIDEKKNSKWINLIDDFDDEYKELKITIDNIDLEKGTATCSIKWSLDYTLDEQTNNIDQTTSMSLYKYDGSWYVQIFDDSVYFGNYFDPADATAIKGILTDWISAYRDQKAANAKEVVDNTLDTAIDNSAVFTDNNIKVKSYKLDYEIINLNITYTENADGNMIPNTATLPGVGYSTVREDTSTDPSTFKEDSVSSSFYNSIDFQYIDSNGDGAKDKWVIDHLPGEYSTPGLFN